MRSTISSTEVSSFTVIGSRVIDLLDLAAMKMRVFIGQPTRSNQEFEPSRSSTLRSGFDPPKEIAFGNNSDQTACLVHHR